MNRVTNLVLTVIAVALVALAIENAIPLVHAQPQIVGKVAICDPTNTSICASLRPFSAPGAYPTYYSLVTTSSK